jgi:C-terminal processing protease CtpA/Prc
VYVAPGPSYSVLSRLGIEIDDRGGAPTVTRIVEGEHAWKKSLREGDIVRAVDGRKVTTRDEALEAIAVAGDVVRITVERRGNLVTQSLPLRSPD